MFAVGIDELICSALEFQISLVNFWFIGPMTKKNINGMFSISRPTEFAKDICKQAEEGDF